MGCGDRTRPAVAGESHRFYRGLPGTDTSIGQVADVAQRYACPSFDRSLPYPEIRPGCQMEIGTLCRAMSNRSRPG
ncbi:protein of unknown function [Burkholderia multivorans]